MENPCRSESGDRIEISVLLFDVEKIGWVKQGVNRSQVLARSMSPMKSRIYSAVSASVVRPVPLADR